MVIYFIYGIMIYQNDVYIFFIKSMTFESYKSPVEPTLNLLLNLLRFLLSLTDGFQVIESLPPKHGAHRPVGIPLVVIKVLDVVALLGDVLHEVRPPPAPQLGLLLLLARPARGQGHLLLLPGEQNIGE